VLSAVGTAFVFPPMTSACQAGDALRITPGRRADQIVTVETNAKSDLPVKIVPGRPAPVEANAVVISPLAQSADRDGDGKASEEPAPILVAPIDDTQSDARADEPQAGQKPAKVTTEKPTARKSDKAPMATETASEKAREAWQQKNPAETQKRQPKNPAAGKSRPRSRTQNRSRANAAADAASGLSEKERLAQTTSNGDQAAAETVSAAAASHGQATRSMEKPASVQAKRDSRSYQEIYRSIPFSRTEYDANPGYRHLATMEIMLGQLHPVIVAPAAPSPPERKSNQTITLRLLPTIIQGGYGISSGYSWR